MFLGILTITWAIFISTIAAWYSVVGLVAMFPGSLPLAIVLFGVAIEGGKVISTVLVHHYWNDESFRKIRIFLISVIIVSMAVTSTGIYGYLSKGYMDHSSPVTTIQYQIDARQTELTHLQETNVALTGKLDQLNKSLSIMLDSGQATKALRTRETQKVERQEIEDQIKSNSEKILTLQNEIIDLKEQTSNVTSKLGPVQYVAKLFGWQDINTAIQLVIGMMMWCFDPLAIMLVISGVKGVEGHFKRRQEAKEAALREQQDREEAARQAALAERQLELQRERELAKIQVSKKATETIDWQKKEIARLEQHIADLSEQMVDSNVDHDTRIKLQTELAQSQSVIDEKTQTIHHLEHALHEATTAIAGFEHDIKEAEKTILTLTDQVATGNASIATLTADLAAKTRELEAASPIHQSDLDAIQMTLDDYAGQLQTSHETIDRLTAKLQEKDGELNDIKTSLPALFATLDQREQELSELKSILDRMSDTSDDQPARISELENLYYQASARLIERDQLIEEQTAAIASLTAAIGEIDKAQRQAASRVEELEQVNAQYRERLDRTGSELDHLRVLLDDANEALVKHQASMLSGDDHVSVAARDIMKKNEEMAKRMANLKTEVADIRHELNAKTQMFTDACDVIMEKAEDAHAMYDTIAHSVINGDYDSLNQIVLASTHTVFDDMKTAVAQAKRKI